MPVETLGQLFLHSLGFDKAEHLLAQCEQVYRPISSAEFYRRVVWLHMRLRQRGLCRGDRVALLSENRWEWAVADFALMTAGMVSVPLYPTLPAEQIHYMLEDSGARAIFVSTATQRQKIESIRSRLPCLEALICFDDEALAAGGQVSDDERREFQAAIEALGPEDLASILYTSGTTGTPKGVMLTHGNLVSNVLGTEPSLGPDDVALSFLPLCHIYERMADYTYYLYGLTVAHVDAVDKVPEALLQVRPTVLAAVPRFYEKLHGRLMEAVHSAPAPRRKLFHWALRVGFQSIPYRLEKKPMPPGLRVKFALAERLVFAKIRERLGGRIRLLNSGGAPLSRELAEFFYAVNLPILEGYGLTETSPVIAANKPDGPRFGTVGKPIRNIEVRIAEDGEILVRGPSVMRGYYKMERETAEAMEGGWFHTGDIGSLDAEGYLTILDRKKDLLKTSGGKYIAPAPIENKIKSSPYIADAVVIADRRRFPSVLVVPDFARVEQFARERRIASNGRPELVRNAAIVELIEREVEQACGRLAQFERVKKVAILDREFSIAEGEMTPTMKVRRREVERRYCDVIEEMYREN